MAIKRRKYTAKFKARVALDAVRGDKTTAEVGRKYGIHPNQVARWKSELLDRISEIFEGGRKSVEEKQERLVGELYEEIGRLKVENDFLKKKSDLD